MVCAEAVMLKDRRTPGAAKNAASPRCVATTVHSAGVLNLALSSNIPKGCPVPFRERVSARVSDNGDHAHADSIG